MSQPIKVLLVEDSEDDCLLVLRNLRKGGYDPQVERVETADAMRTALSAQAWDIILSDYSLPHFSAPAALAVLKETGLDIPFIIISGTIGEDTAVSALKAGAHDFIVKGNLARLVPAIDRELRDAEARRARLRSEKTLRETEERYRAMFEKHWAAKLIIDPQTYAILDANPAACAFYGYSRDEILSKKLTDFDLPTSEPLADQLQQVLADQRQIFTLRQRLGTKESRYVEIYPCPIDVHGETLLHCIVHDVTQRRVAVEELRAKKAEFEAIFLSIPDVVIFTDVERRIIMMNPAFTTQFGYAPIEIQGKSIRMLYGNWEDFDEQGTIRFSPEAEPELKPYEMLYRKKNSERFFGEAVGTPVRDADGDNLGYLVIIRDITERKRVEKALQQFNERLSVLHAIDRAILTEQSLEAVAQLVLHYFVSKHSIWGVGMALIDPERREGIMFEAYRGNEGLSRSGIPFALDRFSQQDIDVLQRGDIQIVEDVENEELSIGIKRMHERGLRSYVLLPLRAENQLVGTLNLGSDQPASIAQELITLAREVADQLAIVIQQARLRDQVQEHTRTLEARVAERTLQLQQAKERVETILHSSSDAIVLLHVDGTIQQTNPAFNRLFGFGSDELFGQPLKTFTVFEDGEVLITSFQAVIEQKQEQRLETIMHRRDGRTLDVDIVLTPIRPKSAPVQDIICSIHDITERKHVERELRGALEKERELNEMKSRFVSMISHDFRTPLTVIQTSTHLLETYRDRMDEIKRGRQFAKIRSQVKRMITMLDDVLMIGKMEAGIIQFNPVSIDLDQFCRSLADEFQGQPDLKHTLVYTYEGGSKRIMADDQLLQRAFSNLLTNAFKYSPEGSSVYFRVSFETENVVIRVQDSGIGIPDADRNRLFESFHRAGNVGSRQGTGLGLAIVKQAVDAHGGMITFESQVNMGTTFIVYLPLDEAKGAGP